MWFALGAALLWGAAAGEAASLCSGERPRWQLRIEGDKARFSFPLPVEMEIPHRTTALGREGADAPQAMTLIGARDTAIVILTPGSCAGGTMGAVVLTQRADDPVMLVGCCREVE
ncbi:MAG: hypothetical protein D6811_10800 [Alphaproteobacteria bacterium]|nr:MAG: hypothetical protein D6811_10800 [Alphaproteobacteria bacterium]